MTEAKDTAPRETSEGAAIPIASNPQVSAMAKAAALLHVDNAEREALAVPGLEAASGEVTSAAVIGAGAMGAGIATCFATAGISVTLVDISAEAVEHGLAAIRQNCEIAVAKGKMTREACDHALAGVASATDYGAIRNADLVVEAVFEDLALKKRVFAELDRACKPEAILATNTSYLDIDAIAGATRRPYRVLGLHFFNPAHIMKLLEIVRAGATSGATLAAGVDIARRLRKTGVVAGVGFGFIGNRMLNAYRTHALNLALEGAAIAQIDKAMAAFGMPMGPFALMDLTGLEVNVKMRAQADPDLIDARAFEVVDQLYAMGRTGQKSGAGFYRYEGGSRAALLDPDVDAMIAGVAARHGVVRRATIADEDIVDRCLLTLVNEGARILKERIALRSGDIDVTYVAGYGFPRHLGGPMYWAEQQGLGAIAARLQRYSVQATPLLASAAQEGLSFDQALR
ncbi:MAG: 3-hydroxyacyl-CoA dehydrogenase family protein [Parvularculaceae bacterium]